MSGGLWLRAAEGTECLEDAFLPSGTLHSGILDSLSWVSDGVAGSSIAHWHLVPLAMQTGNLQYHWPRDPFTV